MAMCCSVLQCVAVFCNVLPCVAVRYRVLQCGAVHYSAFQYSTDLTHSVDLQIWVCVCCNFVAVL